MLLLSLLLIGSLQAATVEFDGSQDPRAIPEWLVWETVFGRLGRASSEPNSPTFERLRLSRDERAQVVDFAIAHRVRERECRERLSKLADPYLVRQEELSCRTATLKASQRLRARLAPAASLALRRFVDDVRVGITASVARNELNHFRSPWAPSTAVQPGEPGATPIEGVTLEAIQVADAIILRLTNRRAVPLEAWFVNVSHATARNDDSNGGMGSDMYGVPPDRPSTSGPIPPGDTREFTYHARGIVTLHAAFLTVAIFADGHVEGSERERDEIYKRREAEAGAIGDWLEAIKAAIEAGDDDAARRILSAKLDARRSRPDAEQARGKAMDTTMEQFVGPRAMPSGGLLQVLRHLQKDYEGRLERATRHRRRE